MTKPNEPFEDVPAHDDTPQDTGLEQEEPQVPAPLPESEPSEPASTPAATKPKVKGSLAAGTWVAMIVGLVLLILLVVFIVQNQHTVEMNLFVWTWNFPASVAYLLSAISGALIVALVGGWRMFELRRQIRHPRAD